MLQSLTILLGFQALGELIRLILLPSIPGPVLGLICLLVFLFVHGRVPEPLEKTAGVFTSNLGLLFVPAAVGVVVLWPLLSAQAHVLVPVLVISVALVLTVTSYLLDQLATRWFEQEVRDPQESGGSNDQ